MFKVLKNVTVDRVKLAAGDIVGEKEFTPGQLASLLATKAVERHEPDGEEPKAEPAKSEAPKAEPAKPAKSKP